jgi:hypothetical protein
MTVARRRNLAPSQLIEIVKLNAQLENIGHCTLPCAEL